jgi:valyl-tRNA synthetase
MSDSADLPTAYDPKTAEATWYARWEESGYFEPSGKGKPFSIVIPPPNVTGTLHIGHALNHTLQDTLIRYHRMLGDDTLWQPGTDHAGIATQMVVERKLAEAKQPSRTDMGRQKFIERVWEWKAESGGQITKGMRALGDSVAWKRERFTMDEGLSAAVRKTFVDLYKKGLIYRDKRLVNWDPKFQTAISDLEVEQVETKGHFWHLRYPIEGTDKAIIVATTRPETMLGDTAVAVHPDDERYKDLVGKNVILPLVGRKIPIVADSYSDPEKGTGAVKITPAHDFNDFEVGKRHNLPLINIFDPRAKMNENVPEQYRGLDRFVARKQIVADLEAAGALVKTEPHTLQVPYGDRSKVVIEPYLTDQWYLDAGTMSKPCVEAVEAGRVQFVPKHWEKTYFEWMRNIQPWCISRQIWWGHQIPAWYGPDGTCFVEETEERALATAKAHYGAPTELTRETDVLDTWFSSALWPFSTLGWPEKTPELARYYPTSVLVTSFDIIFFWVARMLMFGMHFMGEVPFKDVYIHALVRDEHGDKMSKSKGNVVDPLHVIEEHGTDTLRFTLTALALQGRDIRLSADRMGGYRAFVNKIWNASRFALMRVTGKVAPLSEVESQLEEADRWILSRLAHAVKDVRANFDAYKFAEAANGMYVFVWDELCDWYIELVKARLMNDDASGAQSKRVAESVLVFAIENAMRLMHPVMPYITEELWHKLPITRSTEFIGQQKYPGEELAKLSNADLEEKYALVQSAIGSVRTIRAEKNLAPSRPIEAIIVVAQADDRKRLEAQRSSIISLGRLSKLDIVETRAGAPEQAATKVTDKLEVIVPMGDLIDYAKEAESLKRAIVKAEQERDKLIAKLGNESFVARAPAEVVAKERARTEELATMLGTLNQSLQRALAAIKT